MPNVHEGLKKLKSGQTILFTASDVLTSAYNHNPNKFQNIKTFGASAPLFVGWIFTKNSPFVPLFKQAANKMFENGQLARIKWESIRGGAEGTDNMEILGIGKLFLPFAIFVALLIISIIPLIIEFCYNKRFSSISRPTI